MNTLTPLLVAIIVLGWKLRKNSDRQTEVLERIASSRALPRKPRKLVMRPRKLVIRPTKKGTRP